MRPVFCSLLFAFSLSLAAAPTAIAQPKDKAATEKAKDKSKETTPEEAGAVFAFCGLSGLALIIAVTVVILATLLFGLMPTYIALKREHPNTAGIVTINLLLGWTFLGWVGALVWALTAFEKPRSRRRRQYDDDYDD